MSTPPPAAVPATVPPDPRRHTYASWPAADRVRHVAAVHPHDTAKPASAGRNRAARPGTSTGSNADNSAAGRGETEPWTVDDVREWLSEAMRTLRRLPLPPHGFPARLRSAMPEPLQEALQAENGPTRMRRPPPSAAQIDRLDRCLEWLMWVEKPEDRMVVSAIALGLHLRKAGRMAGRSHEWARRHEKAALQGIVDRLNRARAS